MVGKIPGLERIDLNVPDPISAARAKGYNMGLVAILDKPETITVYAQHPAHMVYVLRHAVTACLGLANDSKCTQIQRGAMRRHVGL